jgi:hypothetical protein
MIRQHPYSKECKCRRCQAVRKLIEPPKLTSMQDLDLIRRAKAYGEILNNRRK